MLVELRCMWGYYDINGYWQPNLLLKMSANDQYRENIKNGYDMGELANVG